MKKDEYFLCGVAMMILCGCSNDISSDIDNSIDNKTFVSSYNTNIRSYSEAFAIAKNSIAILDNSKSRTRGIVRKVRTVNENDYIVICSKESQTRSFGKSQTDNDTLLYVFNFNDNEGFAVVSASKNTEGLLAVTERGHYSDEKDTENPGFDIFMDLAEKYVRYSGPGLNPQPPIGFVDMKDSVHIEENYIGPYITVRWGQNSPEGDYCPNYTAGCAPTAIAQTMTYFQYPDSLYLSYMGNDAYSQSINWIDVKKHISIHQYGEGEPCEASSDSHNTISKLCRQIGHLANSYYGYIGETTTTRPGVITALQNIGYTTSIWVPYSLTPIEQKIEEGKLLLISGAEIGQTVGHTWVLDGIYTYTKEVFFWIRNGLEVEWTLTDHTITTTRYHHYNWGKNGSNNGYFYSGVFNIGGVQIPDTENNGGTSNYNYDVQCLCVYL